MDNGRTVGHEGFAGQSSTSGLPNTFGRCLRGTDPVQKRSCQILQERDIEFVWNYEVITSD